MKFKKLLALGAALVFSVAFIAGCGSNNSDNGAKKELSYSKSKGPYSELFEKGVKPILEKQGYTFKGVDMSDLVQADQVLSDGEVDFNVEQHTAYMKNFNEKQNGHLVALTPIPTVPAGIFSGSKTSLDQVADGDTIAVPNDASNMARAYALLQKIGWIKLDPNKDLATVTQADIIENPKNLTFKTDIDPGMLVTVYEQNEGDAVLINTNYALDGGLNPMTDSIAMEGSESPYVNIIAVNSGDENRDDIKTLVEVLRSKEIQDFIVETYAGAVVPVSE